MIQNYIFFDLNNVSSVVVIFFKICIVCKFLLFVCMEKFKIGEVFVINDVQMSKVVVNVYVIVKCVGIKVFF